MRGVFGSSLAIDNTSYAIIFTFDVAPPPPKLAEIPPMKVEVSFIWVFVCFLSVFIATTHTCNITVGNNTARKAPVSKYFPHSR